MGQDVIETLRRELPGVISERVKGVTDELSARLLALEQLAGERAAAAGRKGGPGPSVFKAALEHQRFKDMLEGANSTGRLALEAGNVKALVSGNGDSPGEGQFPTQAQRGPIILEPQRRLTLLDVLPVLPVTSNAYEWAPFQVGDAGIQESEGGTKPAAATGAVLESAPIVTFAVHETASAQVLADNPRLAEAISRMFRYRVRARLERAIVRGAGTAPADPIKGLEDFGTAFVATESAPVDKVSEAIASLDAAGYAPGVVALHPLDWHEIRTSKAAGGSGTYFAGSYADPSPPSTWGLPVVTVASMTRGTGVVLDPRCVAVLDREQAAVMMSREHSDNFTRNLVTILAELRAGFAIFDAEGVAVLDLNASGA